MKSVAFCLLALFFWSGVAARANDLPARLEPSAPFPRIIEQAPTIETIAPGVEYGDYQLETTSGPLAIHVVAVEPHRGDLRIGFRGS